MPSFSASAEQAAVSTTTIAAITELSVPMAFA
jgi:hypothetical protein